MVERKPTSLKVDLELWEEVKIMSIRVHKNITKYFEDALRERLVKDYEIVAAERKRKEQERLEQEQLDQRYQQIINTDPGVDAYNKDKDRSKTIHQLGEEQPKKVGREIREEIPPDYSQKQQDHIFDYDTVKPLGNGNVETTIWMPDLEFPTNKNKLIQHAEKVMQVHHTSYQLDTMKRLPDTRREYKNASELERELRKFYNTDKEMLAKLKRNNWKTVAIHINSDKKWQQPQQQKQQVKN